MAYLSLLAKPSFRQAWRWVFQEFYRFALSIPSAFKYWFSFRTVARLVRLVLSLKTFPESMDGWIALCLLPFKTCVVATFPIIWAFEKINSFFQPYGKTSWPSFELVFQCYLISLLALLLGALVQAIFCRAGRATTTLRFFTLGFVLLFVSALMPRI